MIETDDSTRERVRPGRARIEKLRLQHRVFDRPDCSLIEVLARVNDLDMARVAYLVNREECFHGCGRRGMRELFRLELCPDPTPPATPTKNSSADTGNARTLTIDRMSTADAQITCSSHAICGRIDLPVCSSPSMCSSLRTSVRGSSCECAMRAVTPP